MPLAIIILSSGCSRPTTLQEVRSEGVLHIITRTAPSIYFEGRNGITGYDYELARRFADHLGVKLRVRVAENNTEILSVLDRNYAHIGLAGLSNREDLANQFHAVPTGILAESVVIYHGDVERPITPDDLTDTTLHMVADSNHEPVLLQHQELHRDLNWQVHSALDAAGILARVQSGEFPVAVVSSNELDLNQVYYPKVKQAFSLGEPEQLSWLFPAEQDNSLSNAAREFLDELSASGTLAQLSERFYGHLDRLNYVGARTFVHHANNRLPKYEALFRNYATEYGLDWRLLAAIGYQESHWRPNAVSPTGVRGLMMLTRSTAGQIGISNRLDAEESIQGGAKYFTLVHRQIPERIPEPDRTWFALASYNVGYGHLEDARRLTESGGKNPDRWMDVKEFLPLLAQKEWYSKTRYGYARGHEPVIYVQNIRRYYDVLAWMLEPEKERQSPKEPWFVELEGAEDPTPTNEPDPDEGMRAMLPHELGMIPPTL
ncbi:membrane-bound lytic murein transglycosylase MltF [Marinobacter sp.]|uniref:membrane-bound lytic murein transglycosylase MltF n=1 Tax=Marinobacter sp. TaxID=50741 RepID=UPI0034A5CE2B